MKPLLIKQFIIKILKIMLWQKITNFTTPNNVTAVINSTTWTPWTNIGKLLVKTLVPYLYHRQIGGYDTRNTTHVIVKW